MRISSKGVCPSGTQNLTLRSLSALTHCVNRADKPAPEIAIDYWRLNPNATLLDVIYAVRSDESTHRFVNHTLANIDGKKDVNPFAIREPDMFVKGEKPGFSRAEAEQYVEKSHVLLSQQPEPPIA